MSKNAVVLYSGGLDSATCLAIARAEGLPPHHELRLRSAPHRGVDQGGAIRAAAWRRGTSDSQYRPAAHRRQRPDFRLAVPKNVIDDGIPVTYVPARNTIFLSFALAWAEVLGAFDIYIGVNALDYSGYPDCRPEYISAYEKMANLATKAGVEGQGRYRIHTPLIHQTKAEIIRRGLDLGVDYALTHSCYDPTSEGLACGAL
ncbi:MAG: 7-cyano-7-deazaguanine synthase [Syntrophotaleaceae bacterium]